MSGTTETDAPFKQNVGDSPLVEFRELAVWYGRVVALESASGVIRPGATGLLGPNGAGKTTLLRALLGFVPAKGGQLSAFGHDPWREPLEVRRRFGYMPEADCHIGAMTGSAFVAFAGELSGLPRSEAISRAHEVLYYVGLGEARYRTLATYSTGMKQRVKLAQALVHDPELLLLDEPTNGLDPDGREEMLALIGDVARRRQMSLVLSSHLLRDVERVCDDVLVVDQGRVVTSGTIAELTGQRREVCDVRLKGVVTAFLTDLKDEGGSFQEREDGYRITLPPEATPELLFRIARDAGVQVRHLRPGSETLEDVFLRAVGHEGAG
jgi:ABC-2 type transport system ATP-binding protein